MPAPPRSARSAPRPARAGTPSGCFQWRPARLSTCPATASCLTRPTRPTRSTRVATIGEHDDARDALAAISLADGSECAAEIGASEVGGEAIDLRRRQSFADRVELGLEVRRERFAELVLQQRGGARDAGLAVGVTEPHAARRVNEDRHDRIARADRRKDRNRAEKTQDENHQREHAQRHQDAALVARQRRERTAILAVRDRGNRRGQQNRQPPGERMREMHESVA